jgi:hypothetical protein
MGSTQTQYRAGAVLPRGEVSPIRCHRVAGVLAAHSWRSPQEAPSACCLGSPSASGSTTSGTTTLRDKDARSQSTASRHRALQRVALHTRCKLRRVHTRTLQFNDDVPPKAQVLQIYQF